MGANWNFPYRFHIECGSDRVVIRSQWDNLLGAVLFGVAYISGLIWIMKANGMLSAPWDLFDWIVPAVLFLTGLFIMVPRRLTVSFDSASRKAVRIYQAAFGLITRRCEIPFDDIACIAVRNFEDDGTPLALPIIRHMNKKVTALAIRGGPANEAISATQAISSATGIALELSPPAQGED